MNSIVCDGDKLYSQSLYRVDKQRRAHPKVNTVKLFHRMTKLERPVFKGPFFDLHFWHRQTPLDLLLSSHWQKRFLYNNALSKKFYFSFFWKLKLISRSISHFLVKSFATADSCLPKLLFDVLKLWVLAVGELYSSDKFELRKWRLFVLELGPTLFR